MGSSTSIFIVIFHFGIEVGDTRQRRFDAILSINMVYRSNTILYDTAPLPQTNQKI